MIQRFLLALILVISSFTTFAADSGVAIVTLIRGEVELLVIGKTIKLQKDDWVSEGSVIRTKEKSFVKLVFVDKSQMNIGPNSEMKIESYSGRDSGVIDLVKGKIRSQVTKDYLQMEDQDKSKLFVKTKNAVMGVRGTDFLITTNGETSSVVLFEGEVLLGTLKKSNSFRSKARLEEIVTSGVRIYPGEFSVVEKRKPPTLPSILNVKQKEILEKNEDMGLDRKPSSVKKSYTKSVVPEGLSGAIVSQETSPVLNEVKNNVESVSQGVDVRGSSKPEGFFEEGKMKPANGSFLHLESGVIIPPSSDSRLDSTTNSYIDSSSSERVDSSGEYQPPRGVEIREDGKILVNNSRDGSGTQISLDKPIPVMGLSQGSQNDQNRNSASANSTLNFNEIRNTTSTTTNRNNSTQDFRTQNQVENVRRTTTTTIRVRSRDN